MLTVMEFCRVSPASNAGWSASLYSLINLDHRRLVASIPFPAHLSTEVQRHCPGINEYGHR